MEQGTSRSRRGLSGADTVVIVIMDVDTAELRFMPHPCFDTCISSSVDFNDGAFARAGGFLHRSVSTRFLGQSPLASHNAAFNYASELLT